MTCQECHGTGDMTPDQIEDHYATSREPVCIRYGCTACGGFGEADSDD